MLSLRTFHLVFILAAMVAADMFGAWAIWHYPLTGDATALALGIAALVGGLALAAYTIAVVRSWDRARIV
jgi:hypothetical protein